MAERLPAAIVVVLLFSCAANPFAASTQRPAAPAKPDAHERESVFARSQLWHATEIPRMNLLAGPGGPGAFQFREVVLCKYRGRKFEGRSPKFACVIGKDDEVKVKYGGANGEVYGEVLATRLLWALGFGADRMYPVNVICQGCPMELGGIERPHHEMRFDPAVIERKMAGLEWPSPDHSGWSWTELDRLSFAPTGAPQAHRDALKLLAVFMQHTDSKPEQQRLLCLDTAPGGRRATCGRPFLMISDLGLTFGRANMTNANHTGGVNLAEWRRTPVWKEDRGCTGNLPKSFSGTLDDPAIGEAGRRFLAGLLAQLSDRQLSDLFESARVQLRLRDPGDVSSGFPTTGEWVDAFKQKRAQITDRHCA